MTEVNFNKILPVIKNWFGSKVSEEACEKIAYEFAIGLDLEEEGFYILDKVCYTYHLDPSEFTELVIDIYEVLSI